MMKSLLVMTSTMKAIDTRERAALLMLLSAFTLSCVNMFMPPQGQIHETVLWYTAQVLLFAGSAFGLDAMIDKKLHQHDDN